MGRRVQGVALALLRRARRARRTPVRHGCEERLFTPPAVNRRVLLYGMAVLGFACAVYTIGQAALLQPLGGAFSDPSRNRLGTF